MEAIALAYPGKDQPVGRVPLPYLADLRLALNVAAADRLPLVAVFGNSEQRKQLEQKLEPLAWSDEFLGRALYVPVNHPEEFKAISGLKTKAGYVVIQPDIFGLKGKVIKEIPIQSTAAQVKQSLSMAVGQHQPSTLTYEQHRSQGADADSAGKAKLQYRRDWPKPVRSAPAPLRHVAGDWNFGIWASGIVGISNC